MAISQLDLFKATVSHQKTGRFIYHARFVPSLLESIKAATGLGDEQEVLQHFGAYTPVDVAMLPPVNMIEPDFTEYYADFDIPAGAFINHLGVLEIPGSVFHFTRYVSPLRNTNTVNDMRNFPYPSVAGYSDSQMSSEVRRAHAQGLVASCWVGHMYEDAWQIRGYEEFLMDMISAPDICEFILDRIMERNLANAMAAASAGVDVIRSGDDVANQRAMMFDPALWRRYCKPRWARVYEAARSIKPDIQIWYHSDGNIKDIVPDLIEIGITILNPVQPECLNVEWMHREYGAQIVFDGTIGTQTTMPFGTPDDVRNAVQSVKRLFGEAGGLIISPTHVLEPDVPVGNVLAFFEAVN